MVTTQPPSPCASPTQLQGARRQGLIPDHPPKASSCSCISGLARHWCWGWKGRFRTPLKNSRLFEPRPGIILMLAFQARDSQEPRCRAFPAKGGGRPRADKDREERGVWGCEWQSGYQAGERREGSSPPPRGQDGRLKANQR